MIDYPWLWPAAALYGRIVERRRRQYREGRRRRYRLVRPVISIGNLTVGGSGKTPLVSWLASELAARGERPAILSRGYGRRGRGLAVASRGAGPLTDPETCGDEPYMLATQVPGAVVVCHERRARAGEVAERELGATVHILDDGFQHLELERAADIVLMRQGVDWRGLRLFPAGPLREPLSALADASALVWTLPIKGSHESPPRPSLGTPQLDGLPAFSAMAREAGFFDLRRDRVASEELHGCAAIAYSALADNDTFFRALTGLGLDLRQSTGFRDHHPLTPPELAALELARRRHGAAWIVTSEKDAVKLSPELPLPIVFLRIEVAVVERGFWDFLAAKLEHFRQQQPGSGALDCVSGGS